MTLGKGILIASFGLSLGLSTVVYAKSHDHVSVKPQHLPHHKSKTHMNKHTDMHKKNIRETHIHDHNGDVKAAYKHATQHPKDGKPSHDKAHLHDHNSNRHDADAHVHHHHKH